MNQQVKSTSKWSRHSESLVDAVNEQYLMFTLGQDTYATPIDSIREIIEFAHMTRVPLVPDFLRGIINLRGSVVPVLDLAARFGRAQTEISRRTCIVIIEIVLEGKHQLMGFIVDAVTEVLDVDPAKLEAAPDFGLGLRADFVTGMINKDDQFIVVLNMNVILSIAEMEQIAQVHQIHNSEQSAFTHTDMAS